MLWLHAVIQKHLRNIYRVQLRRFVVAPLQEVEEALSQIRQLVQGNLDLFPKLVFLRTEVVAAYDLTHGVQRRVGIGAHHESLAEHDDALCAGAPNPNQARLLEEPEDLECFEVRDVLKLSF